MPFDAIQYRILLLCYRLLAGYICKKRGVQGNLICTCKCMKRLTHGCMIRLQASERGFKCRSGMLFLETSAKTAANCALVFETVAKKAAGYVEGSTDTVTQGSSPRPPASEAIPPMSTNSGQEQQWSWRALRISAPHVQIYLNALNC